MPRTNTDNPSETNAASPPVSLPALLRDRDIPCPKCRYNLRNLTTNRCPECGQELSIDLLLRPPPRFDYAWLLAWTAIIPSAFYGTRVWYLTFLDPTSYWDEGLIYCMWRIYYLVSLPITILLLIFRHRFSRVRPPIRWAIAAVLAAPFLYDLCHTVFARSNY